MFCLRGDCADCGGNDREHIDHTGVFKFTGIHQIVVGDGWTPENTETLCMACDEMQQRDFWTRYSKQEGKHYREFFEKHYTHHSGGGRYKGKRFKVLSVVGPEEFRNGLM